MKLSKKQKTELIGKLILLILTSGMIAIVIYFVVHAAEANHKEPEPPTFKIETARGLEYPKE